MIFGYVITNYELSIKSIVSFLNNIVIVYMVYRYIDMYVP